MKVKLFGEYSIPWRSSVDPRRFHVWPKELGDRLHCRAVRFKMRSTKGVVGLEEHQAYYTVRDFDSVSVASRDTKLPIQQSHHVGAMRR